MEHQTVEVNVATCAAINEMDVQFGELRVQHPASLGALQAVKEQKISLFYAAVTLEDVEAARQISWGIE